jgi:hypothetical protein
MGEKTIGLGTKQVLITRFVVTITPNDFLVHRTFVLSRQVSNAVSSN